VLKGAAARLGKKGDLLTIMSFAALGKKKADKWRPCAIVLGPANKIVSKRGK